MRIQHLRPEFEARLPKVLASGHLSNAQPLVRTSPATSPLPAVTAASLLPDVRITRTGSIPTLPRQRRVAVASLDLSRPDVALPYGVPRHINVATLKAIAGGDLGDRLLKKTMAGWEFMANDAMVDLADGSQEYRLGRLT